jgi:hypothetical protein
MRAAGEKGTSELVAPHELSSKFLLRMRGEDRPSALAFLDEQAILRQVLRALRSPPGNEASVSGNRFAGRGSFDRTRIQAATTTTGDRASRQYTGGAELIEHTGTCRRG